jgi:hypothetical protein
LTLCFQIATSAKKLWGVEEHQKDDKGNGTGGNILQHLGDHHQVWRDTTWSNAGEFNCVWKSTASSNVRHRSKNI